MTRDRDRPKDLRRYRPWICAAFALSLSTSTLLGVSVASAAPLLLAVTHFRFEQQAQQYCPNDSIVWAIAQSGIYHSNTERWYGQTSDGTYVCRKDAEAAGYHPSRISQ